MRGLLNRASRLNQRLVVGRSAASAVGHRLTETIECNLVEIGHDRVEPSDEVVQSAHDAPSIFTSTIVDPSERGVALRA